MSQDRRERKKGPGRFIWGAAFIAAMALSAASLLGWPWDGDSDLIFRVASRIALAEDAGGSGRLTVQERSAPAFDRIKLADTGQLFVSQGPVRSVSVTTDDNLIDRFQAKVRNGQLVLRFERGCRARPTELKIVITTPDLRAVDLSGSGRLVGQGLMTTDSFDLIISGSGRARLALEAARVTADLKGSGRADLAVTAQELATEISGSGSFRLSGRAREYRLGIKGSGAVEARRLAVETARVEISGSGDCDLHVANRLDVAIRGKGKVVYQGDPQVSSDIKGSGVLRRVM